MKISNLLILFILLTILSSSVQAAEPVRALKLVATDATTHQTGEVELYRKSVAVIIGIDHYANLPADRQLHYAVHDAKGVANVLQRQYKFDKIYTLYDQQTTRSKSRC